MFMNIFCRGRLEKSHSALWFQNRFWWVGVLPMTFPPGTDPGVSPVLIVRISYYITLLNCVYWTRLCKYIAHPTLKDYWGGGSLVQKPCPCNHISWLCDLGTPKLWNGYILDRWWLSCLNVLTIYQKYVNDLDIWPTLKKTLILQELISSVAEFIVVFYMEESCSQTFLYVEVSYNLKCLMPRYLSFRALH